MTTDVLVSSTGTSARSALEQIRRAPGYRLLQLLRLPLDTLDDQTVRAELTAIAAR